MSLQVDTYLDLQSIAKIRDPILPRVSILGYWAILLGSFGGPGRYLDALYKSQNPPTSLPE